MPSPLQAGQICGGGMFFRRFPREMGKSHGKVGQNWGKIMEVSEMVNVFRPSFGSDSDLEKMIKNVDACQSIQIGTQNEMSCTLQSNRWD
jgi:hypothetical protein